MNRMRDRAGAVTLIMSDAVLAQCGGEDAAMVDSGIADSGIEGRDGSQGGNYTDMGTGNGDGVTWAEGIVTPYLGQ
jgi:hypothetical protein